MAAPAGQIIYKAFAPTIKMALVIASGYVITKVGLFPPASAKGVSIVSLNIGLPCLIFSSQVVAFTPENISAFGPLALCAVLYQILGALLAWLIKEIFYVPVDFRWGILVMGAISNWSNLPTSVVQTMATASPFNPATDVELGIAYISIFVLIMNTLLFATGLHKVCAWDFRDDLPIETSTSFKDRWGSRVEWLNRLLNKHDKEKSEIDPRESEKSSSTSTAVAGHTSGIPLSSPISYKGEGSSTSEPQKDFDQKLEGGSLARKTSRTPSLSSVMGSTRRIAPTEPLDAPSSAHQPLTPGLPDDLDGTSNTEIVLPTSHSFQRTPSPPPPNTKTQNKYFGMVKTFLKSFFGTPASIAVVVALPCALIQPIKALFTNVDGWSGTRVPYGPDGKPALAFILDTTQFLGGIAVPAGLILLGASFARLEMPKRWRDLPLSAIVAMTAVKMIIVPIFGIFFVQGLQARTNLFPPADKIRTFVAILLSGTPAAANQLILTQMYNPTGSAHTIASFLLLQYIAMFVLCTALAAIALYIVEI